MVDHGAREIANVPDPSFPSQTECYPGARRDNISARAGKVCDGSPRVAPGVVPGRRARGGGRGSRGSEGTTTRYGTRTLTSETPPTGARGAEVPVPFATEFASRSSATHRARYHRDPRREQ